MTVEGGYKAFKDSNGEGFGLIPLLAGYRYTLDRSGEGFFAEPYTGYTFGGDMYGSEEEQGLTTGLGIGYLVDLGNIPFNFAFRYEHHWGSLKTNVISLRVVHSFRLRK